MYCEMCGKDISKEGQFEIGEYTMCNKCYEKGIEYVDGIIITNEEIESAIPWDELWPKEKPCA